MDYASQQRGISRNPVGIGIVLLMHVALVWALVAGLGRKVVEIIKQPIETKIIEEVKPPPPPPPENLPPPPKTVAPPPPSYVPPPEINVPPPPTPAPSITVTREPPPPAPTFTPSPPPAAAPVAPAAPPAPPAQPPAPPAPAKKPASSAHVDARSCIVVEDAYPPAALRAETSGTTRLRLTVGPDGVVSGASIVGRSGPSREHGLLDRAAVAQFTSGSCKGRPSVDADGNNVAGTVDVDIVWKINN